MENWKKKAIELVCSLGLREQADPKVINYYPQKTSVSSDEEKFFRRGIPERQGVSSLTFLDMLADLEAEPRANIHSLLVVKDGMVILEATAPGYDINTYHLSYSMSKTVTGIGIGCLVDDGKLDPDTHLRAIFPEYTLTDRRTGEITVRELLTMRTGIPFAEAGSVTSEKWTEDYLASKPDFTPGTAFAYNSMNSYILARIIERISGMPADEFIDRRLFSPLGIKNYLWEKSPEGTIKGGWGLYLSAESWAKIGWMMLSEGEFFGKRILSPEWVKESTEAHSMTPVGTGDFNYGYHLWVSRTGSDFLFNGMLGQNVWVSPKDRMVAVILSGNNELFSDSPALNILRYNLTRTPDRPATKREYEKYRAARESFFVSRMPARLLPERRGLRVIFRLMKARPFPESFTPLLGEYRFVENDISLTPVMSAVMQNNYKRNLSSLKFVREGERLIMTAVLGDTPYTLDTGLYDFSDGVIDVNGEKYRLRIAASGEPDRMGGGVYRFTLLFPELPNVSYWTMSLSADGVMHLSVRECPDQKIAGTFFGNLPATNPKAAALLGFLERRIAPGYLKAKLNGVFEKDVVCVRTDCRRGAEVLAEEDERCAKRRADATRLLPLISIFTKTDERGGGIIGRLFGR